MRWYKRHIILCILIALLHCFGVVFAQDDPSSEKKISLSGYISDMQSVTVTDASTLLSSIIDTAYLASFLPDSSFDKLLNSVDSLLGDRPWLMENTIHNRLNFQWDMSKSLSLTIQARNRFIYGDNLRLYGDAYKDMLGTDYGVTHMTWNVVSGDAYLLNINIDRLFFDVTIDKLNIRVGRQRINWGQNFVWNPNDIFNVYSYFDVDYPERPGSDAIRLQYYPGMATTCELTVKLDNNNDVTLAGLYRFNKWQYDFQIMGGVLNSEDITLGVGWTGNIKNAGFSGELAYFHPIDNLADTSGLFLGAISCNYSFRNASQVQLEFLYSNMGAINNPQNFMQFYYGPLSVKNIAITEYNLMAQFIYPATPLLNISIAGMGFLGEIKGVFIGPSIDYSLTDNLTCSFIAQLFYWEVEINPSYKIKQDYEMFFLKLKQSF